MQQPTPIKTERQRGRPGIARVRIDDCRSVKLFDNPADRCPHGKSWRESDFETAAANVKALMCDFDTCEAVEFYPHVGEHVVLRVPRTFAARRPVMRLVERTTNPDASQQQLVDTLMEIVSGAVEEWTWTGSCDEAPYGACEVKRSCQYAAAKLPLPSADPGLVEAHLQSSEMWFIVNAVMAQGDPYEADAGKVSGG
tara:strand:+ start:680 stop:1270 length:591 start_codon:yes stop_codon:yes gene_type:complete